MKIRDKRDQNGSIDKESISRPLGSFLQSGHSTCQYFEYLILSVLLSRKQKRNLKNN